MTLVAVGLHAPTAALAADPITACKMEADPATAFETAQVSDDTTTVSLGCARDAATDKCKTLWFDTSCGLRPFLKDDNDLVLVLGFHGHGHSDDDYADQMATEIHDAQDGGQSLSEYLKARAHRYDPGIYTSPADGVDFDGLALTSYNSLIIVVPVAEVGTTANWWQKSIAVMAGFAAGALSGSVCLALFNVGSAVAGPICGAVSGFMSGVIGEVVNAAFDGRSISDGDVWAEAVAVGVCSAIGGALVGKLLAWAEVAGQPLVTKLQILLKGLARKLWFGGSVLETIASLLTPFAPAFYAAVKRIASGIGVTSDDSDLTSHGANPYPSDAKTFTVKAGATTFSATQPRDSVATYTWTDGASPQEWLTSASGGTLNRKLQPVRVAGYGGSTDTITVDAGRTYQQIDGFGGAMTDSAAALIAASPKRDSIMRTLFGTGEGQAGLTMVRSPMGSSDLMADGNDVHTYEDNRGGFSADAAASDRRQLDALVQAKAIVGGNFKLIGTPWSAPGWAKRGGTLKPSECGTDANEIDPAAVPDYAGYFKRYVDAYAAKGVKPWMVSMQNEPQNCKTAMPTTLLSATDEVALAKELKRQLPGDVKVLGFDHNWNDKHYVDTLIGQGGGAVDAIGYHCYDGTHYANQTQAVATYMTECSGFTDQSGNVATNLGWEVANTLMGPLRHGSRGSIYWSLAQDQNGKPHLNTSDACQTCRGMITTYGDGGFEPSQDFYFYAQFSAFVRPGAFRVESSNSGDVSTVAFRDGNKTTLVVLVSGTHADGGSAGSDERDLRGHLLQFNGENKQQKTSWLVGADGYRRWIGDSSTYNCLKYDAGMQGPDDEPGGALDKYINIKDVWAVCGAVTMGTRSELEVGTYLKTAAGARLTLTKDGLRAVDSGGHTHWTPPGKGDRLILQEDQNLVLYSGTSAVWSSGTRGSGAIWLSLRDDGTFALFDKANKKVWVSQVDAREYRRAIVHWDGDTSAQKTSWMVGNDGNRRWIPDLATFQCLHDAGSGNAVPVSSDVLDKLPDLTNVWATCGADRIGVNGAIEEGSYLQAGDYRLSLTSGELALTKKGTKVWTTGLGGAQLKLQSDGNLVVYDKNGGAKWATYTNGKSAGWLVLGTDGSLRLYDAGGKQVWAA